MDAFAKALLFMLPAFFLMIIIEAIYARYKGKFNFRTMDVVSSLSAGMTNALKSVLGLTILIVGYDYLFEHFALIERCLLYTSPSPRDQRGSRMPSSA